MTVLPMATQLSLLPSTHSRSACNCVSSELSDSPSPRSSDQGVRTLNTVRLTTCQALVRYLCTQRTATGERSIAGFWAIFGRCNVAALGDALYAARADMPTSRGHNEQVMAHVAIAFSKAHKRRRAMVVTTSIGRGATNVVTAAALAHVNCLPVLLFPADVFANRQPDPVL